MATFEKPQHPYEQNELNDFPFCKCGLAKDMHEVISDKTETSVSHK